MWIDKAKQAKIPEKAGKLWGADIDFIKLVHSGRNQVFKMKCGTKVRYLHITWSLFKSREELAAAIDYQRYLFETGAHVCQPVKSLNDHYVEKISWQGDTFYAYANDEVEGDAIHFDLNDNQAYEAWGKSLAHLHRVAKSYRPAEIHQFLYWHDLWDEVKRLAADENEIIKQEVTDIDAWFGNLDITPHHFGLTHGDHRTGNVFYDGNRVHIIDFEEAVHHWYFADMARPFLELSNAEFEEWREKAMCFLDGYYTIMPYEQKIMHYLPWFMRMKNLELYLWRKNLPANSLANIHLAEMWENIQRPLLSWE